MLSSSPTGFQRANYFFNYQFLLSDYFILWFRLLKNLTPKPLQELDVLTQTPSPATWEAETRRLYIQKLPGPHSEFKGSLGNLAKPFLKIKIKGWAYSSVVEYFLASK